MSFYIVAMWLSPIQSNNNNNIYNNNTTRGESKVPLSWRTGWLCAPGDPACVVGTMEFGGRGVHLHGPAVGQ